MGLVMLCSLVSFFGDWVGDVGWWSWCCDSRDCGGLRGIRGIGVIVIVYWEVVGGIRALL